MHNVFSRMSDLYDKIVAYCGGNSDPDVTILEFDMENDSELETELEARGETAGEEEAIGAGQKSYSTSGLIIYVGFSFFR